MISSMTDLPSIALYLKRIGAEERSLRTAVIKEKHGVYWTDIATIRIEKDGSVTCPKHYAPTDSEAVFIKQEVMAASWPTSTNLGKTYELPDVLKGLNPEELFELRTREGNVIMLQQRVLDRKTGEKSYQPWSFWSDRKWRRMEPEGELPLFGLETLKDHTTVFIHEGAKAARRVQRLINPRTAQERQELAEHPWSEELKGAAHLGWIGGALSPLRTDWSELQSVGIQRAYIVADNDSPGKSAIPRISERLKGITTFSVEFTELWPPTFDLADDFPPKMFSRVAGAKVYTGPAFRDVLHPATWATDMVPIMGDNGKVKMVPSLRKEFRELWAWVEQIDCFICKEMPHIKHGIGIFNAMVAPFSHVSTTGQLVQKSYKGRTAKICYRPDTLARVVTDKTTSAINMHTPTTVKANEASYAPWEEFLDYLLPIERERKELKRWCATLIARPDVRMLYGMLVVSETQGMGKSTLGERILAPLVGLQNTGFPGEKAIVETNFNSWVANKRLIVVGEIYTGQSFKAYNILKSYITDKNIEVNEKFERTYVIDNWSHIIACSNSKKALRIEETDRRWFCPQLSEKPWSKAKWREFYEWLESGGLGAIMRWAHEFGDYVSSGEQAPMTVSKSELIEDSKGEVLNHWVDILESSEAENEEVVFALNEVLATMKRAHGKVYETALQLKKEALKRGWASPDSRITIDGAMSYYVLSPVAKTAYAELEEDKDKRSYALSKLFRLKERVSGM